MTGPLSAPELHERHERHERHTRHERHGRGRAAAVTLLIVVAAVAGLALVLGANRAAGPSFIVRAPAAGPSAVAAGTVPRTIPLSIAMRARTARSIVRVTGIACQEIQQGSGFVVRPGYVITNAHVVAGERTTSVIDHAGNRMPVTVVRFDPVRDLALLRIDGSAGATIPSLSLAAPRPPEDLAVFGHPGGGSLRIAPARLSASGVKLAVGRDIYQHTTPTSRRILALAARLAPGDSGAAVVDTAGHVIGVAFAIDPDGHPVAYALPESAIASMARVTSAAGSSASTGPCTPL